MRVLVDHFASGDALFSGAVLLLLGVWYGRAGRPQLATMLVLASLIVILLSSTPLPPLLYLSWGMALVYWFRRGTSQRPTILLAAVTLVCVGSEVQTFLRRLPQLAPDHSVAILGDSLTAQYEGDNATWTDALAGAGRHILNLATPGARLADGIVQAAGIPEDCQSVIIFLGGNDILGGTSFEEFASRLDRLLAKVARRERTVYVVELPLVPFGHLYGGAQRRLAQRHGAALISKRIVSHTIFRDGATTDGLHLSSAGARHLGEAIAARIGP